MKKTYITPATEALEFHTEQMLAMSVNIYNSSNDDTDVLIEDAMSHRKHWGSNIWKN